MYNRVLWVFACLLVCAAVAVGQTDDPGARDTLYVGSVEANAGEKAIVEVNFFNDEELAALTIPLIWSSPDITLDSVSYVGSRVDYLGYLPLEILPEIRKVVFGAVVFMEENIQPGYGLLAKLYFDIPPGTPDQFVYIDSTTKDPAELLFTNLNSSSFTPYFFEGQIKIGDPVLYPHIELSLSSMYFEGIYGYPSPSSQTLRITNSGGGDLEWTATTSSGWLTIGPSSGTAPTNVSVHADISGLVQGTYHDTVVVICPDADNSPQYLPVTFTITTLPPEIEYEPQSFTLSAVQGGVNPEDRYLRIWSDVPGSELNWAVTNSSTWLTLTPTGGISDDSVTLSFDIAGLSYGNYADTIVISDPTATNSPQYVPVTLQVVSDLPVLEIDPPILHVNVPIGTNAIARPVTVYNSGEGVMTFSATESSTRIGGLTPSSGTAPDEILISFTTIRDRGGDYDDTVIVTSPEAINSPQYLIVRFHISEDPAQLMLIPTTLDFVQYECWQGPNPIMPVETFRVDNYGTDSMAWWLEYDADWLELSAEAGVDDALISATVDASGMALGEYTDTVRVYSDDAIASPKSLVITLSVIPGTETPELVLSETVVDLPAQEVFGTTRILYGITEVFNNNPGCMDYWIEEDVPWLKLIDSSGTAPDIPHVGLDVGSYTYGVYPDSIWFYSSTASNSPVKLYVNMLVWHYHGDLNWDNRIDVADIVYLVNYVFKAGLNPKPEMAVGDCDCDRFITVGDIVILVNHVFKGGNTPCGNP